MRRNQTFGTRRAVTVIAFTTMRRAARSGALWGLVFGGYVALQASAYGTTYPTVAAREKVAQSFAGNAGLAALVGPAVHLETVAGYMSWRLGVLNIIGAIWGLLLATRLLRGEEEAGRWELLLSGQTTRGQAAAQAVGGLAVGIGTLWALTALLTVTEGARSAVGFTATASVFYATAATASAAMFVAIGVLAGQLSATRRRASGIAAAVFGASFLIRMVADSTNGLQWLRWASPLGWVEELHPLIGTRPAALVPITALVLASISAALVIAARRDLGASVLSAHDTAPAHTRMLNGPEGLAVRLTRSVALGWIAAIAALGLVMGLVAQSAAKAISGSKAIERAIARLGGNHSGAQSYLGFAFLIVAALVAFAAAGQIAAARSDEADGYLDNLLVRPVARTTWLAGQLGLSATILIVASCIAGIAAWVGAATQHSNVALGTLVQAGVNVAAPAILVLGVGALVYGIAPRFVTPVTYGLVAWSFIIEIIGSSIKANHWILDTAVLSHITPAPAANPNWTAVAWLTALGLIGAAIGTIGFNRRDLVDA